MRDFWSREERTPGGMVQFLYCSAASGEMRSRRCVTP